MKTTPPSTPTLEDLDKEARAIESLGLRYQTITVDLNDIDLIGSETFNQRFESRSNDDVVVQYALLMERGVQFPKGTVLFDTAARKYKVISGFHRINALILADTEHPNRGFDKVEMFEVIVTPAGDPATMEKIETLGYLLNTTGVYGLSQPERYNAAIKVINERGISIEDASNQFGLDADKLQTAKENYDADKALTLYGLDPANFERLKDKQAVVGLPDQFWMREAEKLLTFRKKDGSHVISQADFYAFVRFIVNNKADDVRQQKLLEVRVDLEAGKKPRRESSLKGVHKPFPVSGLWRRGTTAIAQVSAVDLVSATAKTEDQAKLLRDEIVALRRAADDIEKALDAKWDSR